MNYFLLAETEFFRLINEAGACNIETAYTAFRLRLKGTSKKKNRQNPVKAPLRHKYKRNGPCFISLNSRLGVRQNPFLNLCGSRHTFVQNSFGRWCADE